MHLYEIRIIPLKIGKERKAQRPAPSHCTPAAGLQTNSETHQNGGSDTQMDKQLALEQKYIQQQLSDTMKSKQEVLTKLPTVRERWKQWSGSNSEHSNGSTNEVISSNSRQSAGKLTKRSIRRHCRAEALKEDHGQNPLKSSCDIDFTEQRVK